MWVEDGRKLVRRVKKELGPAVAVEVLWPPDEDVEPHADA